MLFLEFLLHVAVKLIEENRAGHAKEKQGIDQVEEKLSIGLELIIVHGQLRPESLFANLRHQGTLIYHEEVCTKSKK